MTAPRAFRFNSPYSRRLPDPVFGDRGMERHVFMVRVREIPHGLPTDSNARQPNINRRIYREIDDSLLNADGSPENTFHLKHKGITLVALNVKKMGGQDSDEYEVLFEDGHGILDGGHTYELITNHPTEDLPDNQWVKVEILTRVDTDWIPDLSGGLNTSLQVQEYSLANLEGQFDDLKNLLRGESYYDELAWKEGEKGAFDARDLVSMLTCFNVDLYPNNPTPAHPIHAYEKKSKALDEFRSNLDSYRKLHPICKDIFRLYDHISREAVDLYNQFMREQGKGGKGGALAFVEGKRRRPFSFVFLGEEGEQRLMRGGIYPILAAFRWYVEEDEDGFYWRGGFESVLEAWRSGGGEMIKSTKDVSDELGRNPNAVGKSRNHWSNLYRFVVMSDLIRRQAQD